MASTELNGNDNLVGTSVAHELLSIEKSKQMRSEKIETTIAATNESINQTISPASTPPLSLYSFENTRPRVHMTTPRGHVVSSFSPFDSVTNVLAVLCTTSSL